jgi:hypothetical protein
MEDSSQKPSLAKRIQEKLAASRFFTFSALLHVVLVVMGGSVVLFKQYVEPPDFVAEGGGLMTNDVAVAPPPEAPPDMSQEAFTPEQPSITPPTVSAITTTNTSSSFQMASVPMPVKAMPTDVSKSLASAAASMTRGLATGLPAVMGGRAGGKRAAAAKMMGGKEKSEKAVMAGLRWLKQNQNQDGSWSPDHKPAMTGLAILAFLGHGETPESPEFGPTVKKGLDWLLEKGNEFQGRMSLTKDGWGGHHGVYEHGIATYAMGEYYTMTKDERFVELYKQAVGYIVSGQAPDGGWNYSYSKEPNSDTSVSGWQIQALKAAHLTGLGIPGVDEALEKAMLNLKRVQSSDGNFHYRKPGDRGKNPSLVGVGVLCTLFWKETKDKVVRDGIEFMLDRERPEVKYKGEAADLYAWYYNTQAALMYGGSAWSKWNRMFQDEVADAQSPDGSWPPVIAKDVPGAEMQRKPDGAGPVYRTALCVLMLEVFYRYMPTTK